MERGFKSRCENLAAEVRSELGLRKTDPLPPESLAKHLGVYLWEPKYITGLSLGASQQLQNDWRSWSAVTVSLGGIDAVIYNPLHSRGRQSSDIMHELAHILLHHKPVEMMLFSENLEIVLREYDPLLEEEANWLSGCLLLPREALLFVKRNGMAESNACQAYGVSDTLLNLRLNKTGINRQIGASRSFVGMRTNPGSH